MSFTWSVYRRSYKYKLKDGTSVQKESPYYLIEIYRDGKSHHRRKGPHDKKSAEHEAMTLVKGLEREDAGLVDPMAPQKARPLSEHAREWVEHLRTAGRSPAYIRKCDSRLKILIQECGWNTLRDVNPNALSLFLKRLKATPRKGTAKGRKETAATTLNQYVDTAGAFLNWCRRMKRVAVNPLVDFERTTGEKVRKRRALTDDEVTRLLAKAPADRALIYRVGLSAGLRRSELAALKWGDLRIDATRPGVQLREEATKARRGDRVYLPPSLADDLRKVRPAEAGDNDPVFTRVPSLMWWKRDLAAAGIPYKDAMGRQVDFHAGTRKTLCTRMHRNNVPLAAAMRIMRHTDARLTMVDYTDDEQVTDYVLPEVGTPAKTTSETPNSSNQAAG